MDEKVKENDVLFKNVINDFIENEAVLLRGKEFSKENSVLMLTSDKEMVRTVCIGRSSTIMAALTQFLLENKQFLPHFKTMVGLVELITKVSHD